MEGDMMGMMDMMKEMNKKMDMMMKAMGCKSMSEEEYISKSDDEKDRIDEEEMKNKMESKE